MSQSIHAAVFLRFLLSLFQLLNMPRVFNLTPFVP